MRFSTPYHLETATPSDLPTLAEIETEAVLPSALNTVFFQSWADTKVQAKFFQSDLEAFLAKPDVHIIKVLNTITGEIEGFMVWYVIESTTTSFSPRSKTLAAAKFSCTPPATLSNPSEALNSGFCSVVFPATEQLKADLLQGQKCAYLNKLFVRPGSQKHGIGSLLVDWAIKKADAEDLDTYLIAVPQPHEFYIHRGFEDRGCYDIDLSPWGPKFGGLGLLRFQGMVRTCTAEKSLLE